MQGGSLTAGVRVIPASLMAHLDLTLVTNNQKHFSKVRGLKTANWSEDE
jgi:predicted nucleic acid-binding protein